MRLRLKELVRQKEAREGRHIRQRELAKALGIFQQQVSVLMRGNYKQVSLRLLDRIAAYFGVSTSELFNGGSLPDPSLVVEFPNLVVLPVLGRINAGPLDEEHQEILDYYPWPTSLGPRPGCFVLLVQGDSMIDAHILPGSRVVIDPNLEPRNGDIVAVLVDGESTLKRLYFDEDGRAALISENREKNYPPIILDPEAESRVQGVVVNIILTPESRRPR